MLRQNTTLRELLISSTPVDSEHLAVLDRLVFDDTSLNAAHDSQHTCYVRHNGTGYAAYFGGFNDCKDPKINRRLKVQELLWKRHENNNNIPHFLSEGINRKHLPNILALLEDKMRGHYRCPLSVVYEILRGWNIPELFNCLDKGVKRKRDH